MIQHRTDVELQVFCAGYRCRVTRKKSGGRTPGTSHHAGTPSHPGIYHRRSPGRIAFPSKLRCQPRNRQQQPVNRRCRHGGCPGCRRRGWRRRSREQKKVHAQHLQTLTVTPYAFCGIRTQLNIQSATPTIRGRIRFAPPIPLAQLAGTKLLPPRMPRRRRVRLATVITGMNQLGHVDPSPEKSPSITCQTWLNREENPKKTEEKLVCQGSRKKTRKKTSSSRGQLNRQFWYNYQTGAGGRRGARPLLRRAGLEL